MALKSCGKGSIGLISVQFRSSSLLRPRPYVLHAMKRFERPFPGAVALRVWNAVETAAKADCFYTYY
jgi:hypothetical protein